MLRDWSALVRSSFQGVTTRAVIRLYALVYLPTTFLVSLFVALTWLGLSMSNGTFRDEDLVIVITYFAALLVLECILLAHVALRGRMMAGLNNQGRGSESSTPTTESQGQLELHPRPDGPVPLPDGGMAERRSGPIPHIKESSTCTGSPDPPRLLPLQKVPALCQPYHPSRRPEINRPTTAAAYTPKPYSPVAETATNLRLPWDLTMSETCVSATCQSPGSAPRPAAFSQAEAHVNSSAERPVSALTVPR